MSAVIRQILEKPVSVIGQFAGTKPDFGLQPPQPYTIWFGVFFNSSRQLNALTLTVEVTMVAWSACSCWGPKSLRRWMRRRRHWRTLCIMRGIGCLAGRPRPWVRWWFAWPPYSLVLLKVISYFGFLKAFWRLFLFFHIFSKVIKQIQDSEGLF